jgi:predicted amidohydrolase YtcJ
MLKRFGLSISFLAAWTLCFCAAQEYPKADFVLLNGKIHTFSSAHPRAEALAAADGKILAVGSSREIQRYVDRDTQVLDVNGKLVIPGLIDSHCHFSSGGRSLATLDVRRAGSISEIQQIIAKKVKEVPEGEPILGRGSFPNTSLFPGLGWPTKELLDRVAPKNPVVIRRGGGHAVWANSLALSMSGVDRDSVAPYGGEIVKDPATGEPTGILKEAAQQLIKVRSRSTPREDIERALSHAAELGLTGITTSSSLREIEIFKKLRNEGKLTLRVTAWLPISGLDHYIKEGIRLGQGDDMMKIGFLKVFLDGTIGVRSALMFESFAEEPGNKGLAQYQEDEFLALIEKAHSNGYQVGVHAIGDKAVHWTLNAIEEAQAKYGKKNLRHRVEHNTVNLLSDTNRFAELGVVASMQPNITGGQAYRERRLGRERARRVDVWRNLINDGAVLSWGTDWPVSSINPMLNLHRLVTRYPEQRLTMEEAIHYYTYGSAYASFDEERKGRLQPGMLADMVVLAEDLFTIDPDRVPNNQILYTILGGRVVYQRN